MADFFRRSKIVTVSGGKGGTGKTFIAVNLAVEMANRISNKFRLGHSRNSRNKILLFDADFHLSNAHLFLGLKLSPYLERFLQNPENMPEYIIPSAYGVDLISFGGDDKKLNEIAGDANLQILRRLKDLESAYEWIVIDTGAGLNEMILRQIAFSDYSLLVTNPDSTALIDCYKMIKFISKDKLGRKSVDVCVNKVASFEEGYASFKRIQGTLEQFKIQANAYFAGPVYYDRKAFNKGLQQGKPVVEMFPAHHFKESMNYIWDTITQKTLSKRMESFFEKIFES